MDLFKNKVGRDCPTTPVPSLNRLAAAGGSLVLLLFATESVPLGHAMASSTASSETSAHQAIEPQSTAGLFQPGMETVHDYPSIPLKHGVLCTAAETSHELTSGAVFPVWQGQYTNLAAVGAGSADSDWIENLLFIMSVAVLGIGLTVLARRPENQRMRQHPVNWKVQISE